MKSLVKYGPKYPARLMADKTTHEEEMALDEWICENDDNMKLFEDLTNDFKAKWVKQ